MGICERSIFEPFKTSREDTIEGKNGKLQPKSLAQGGGREKLFTQDLRVVCLNSNDGNFQQKKLPIVCLFCWL